MSHVLVVDDDADVRRDIRRHLERAGCSVSEAADGAAAEAADSHRPADIVILDVHMPNRDGIETLRAFRAQGRPAKIIMIGGGCPACRVDFLPIAERLGADATLRKPITEPELRRVVAALMGRPAALREEA